MFPRSRKRKQTHETEADEEDMASRLQLDMGVYVSNTTGTELIVIALYILERDSLARKSARSGEKHGAVNVFRGINFDDWLRLFMQVYPSFLSRKLTLNSFFNSVLLYLDETGSIRCCRRNPSACHDIQRVSAQRTAGFHPDSYY